MGAADASTTVLGAVTATASGLATVDLNAAGVQVVQAWVNDPAANFGLLLADYTAATDLVVFTSREGNVAANRPRLTVTYVPGSAPLAAATDAAIASWGKQTAPAKTHRAVAGLATTLTNSADPAQRIKATDELAKRSSLPAPRSEPRLPTAGRAAGRRDAEVIVVGRPIQAVATEKDRLERPSDRF
jgi:hypothetical protein